jgi:putative tricarboxylic transport membrane protein
MRKEQGSSLVWLGIAVLICIGSLRLSLGSFKNPGPGFFPFIAGLVLGILAATVFFHARRAAAAGKETEQPLWTNLSGVKKVVLTTIALLVYAISMEYLGFLISTFIFFVFLLRTIEPQRWGLVILESLLASGISYLVFEIWLQAQLPKGILPL